jgi:hypothetical protein
MTASLASPVSPAGALVGSQSWTQWQRAKIANPLPKTGSQVRQSLRFFGKSSLRANWESHCDQRLSRISSLPEHILELYEDNKIQISDNDVEFLLGLAFLGTGASEMSNAAIRLLGILLEEDEDRSISLLHSKGVAILSLLVDHPESSRRYTAIKALWQGKAIKSIHTLQMRLPSESNDLVRQIAEQAVDVLTRYANISEA